jgi:hypothetical protein
LEAGAAKRGKGGRKVREGDARCRPVRNGVGKVEELGRGSSSYANGLFYCPHGLHIKNQSRTAHLSFFADLKLIADEPVNVIALEDLHNASDPGQLRGRMLRARNFHL